jgi:hypothetical protein
MRTTRTTLALTIGALPLAAGVALAPSAVAADDATVTVVHGVPGLTVDVFANGKELLPDFKPGTVTKPLQLPAGSYDLAVFANGQGPGGTPAIKADNVAVPAGANASVVAHLDAAGKPKLSVFVNDTSKVEAGKARLTVRHTAAAPAVDVRAGGQPVFTGLTNPNEKKGEVPAGTVNADVVLAGTDTVAIGPADLELAEGTSTVVYAWGNGAAGYKLATQQISGLHSAPGGVPAGEAGLADDGALPAWALGLMAAAVVGAGFSARRLVPATTRR